MKNINFKISKEEFQNLLFIVDELNKISDTHKIKWDGGNVILYSILGDGEGQNQKIDVVKVFIYKRENLFKEFEEDKLVWIIARSKKWLKQVKFLKDDDEDVEVSMNINDNKIYSVQFKTSVLQINTIAGDDIIKDIPMNFIKEKMNPKYANWTFNATTDFIKRVKKLNDLDNNNDIISIASMDGSVTLKEDALWDLKIVPNKEVPPNTWLIKKEHFDRITLDSDITFGIFDTHVAVKEKESTMLFTLNLIN
jgi:hypothetical protein